MKLLIENMVCRRCVLVIEREQADLNIQATVELGFIELENQITNEQVERIAGRIVPLGFEILTDNKNKQVEEIKSMLIRVIQGGKVELHFSVKKILGF